MLEKDFITHRRTASPSVLQEREGSQNNVKYKRIIIVSAVALILGLVGFALCCVWNANAPFRTITQSRILLHQARQARAAIFAPKLLKETEKSWDQMLQEWRRQNNKSIFTRDYSKVGELALQTAKNAKQAVIFAISQKDSLKEAVRLESIIVQETILNFKKRYEEVPVDYPTHYKLITGELLLSESRAAFRREDYIEAKKKIIKASSLIGQSETELTRRLKVYLLQLPLWRKWAAETIEWSKSNSQTVIIVDKLGRRCKLYKDGLMETEFVAEFGYNWIGPKRSRGDDATPEGHYHIKKKKQGKYTKYYLALEIDYPNEHDLERFNHAKQNGELPANAAIGGLIEIHGGGGEGRNWTNGCVAVKNSDMDKIFSLVDVGTPVTIVGALENNSSAF